MHMPKTNLLVSRDKDTSSASSERAEKNFSPIIGVSKGVWAAKVITHLINETDAVLYGNEEYFMLKLRGKRGGISPKMGI